MDTLNQILLAPFVAVLVGLLVVCSLWLYGVSRDRLAPGVHSFASASLKGRKPARRGHHS
jgi:hypothetical protein